MDMLERYESTGPTFRPDALMQDAQGYDAAESVRPRKVELPETRRTERPAAEEAVDPLGAMRGAWNSLRAEERTEPVVVHLAERVEPQRRSLWIEDDEDEPLVALPRAAAPADPIAAESVHEEPAEEEAVYEAAEPERPEPLPALAAEESASLDAVLAAMADEPAAPAVAAEHVLPRSVAIWREIVARNTDVSSNSPIVAMIDQLLLELSHEEQSTGQAGLAATTMIERTRAA
jgi:hypothetical protein